FGIRSSLAHGNPDDKGDGVHVFLGGEHRPYRWDRIGDFAGRLPWTALNRYSSIVAENLLIHWALAMKNQMEVYLTQKSLSHQVIYLL
ncbi:hypothetical protein, partial [Pseudomonas silesiensis]|uniref:hypothetical protein n=1 Tax=Pseudomonas silesiensis TaxID=1853130 RepID=UPI0030D91FBF